MNYSKALRSLELANDKRRFYVCRDSKIHSFSGIIDSPNGRYILNELRENGASGPWTLDEAKVEAKRRFEKRSKLALEKINFVQRVIERNSEFTMDDFLEFKK